MFAITILLSCSGKSQNFLSVIVQYEKRRQSPWTNKQRLLCSINYLLFRDLATVAGLFRGCTQDISFAGTC